MSIYLPELGHFCLLLAMTCSVSQFLIPVYGYFFKKDYMLRINLWAAVLQAIFIIAAYAILTHAFLVNDFSLPYVARNSLTNLPLIYKFTAVWGAHEGSLLLWVTLLNIWTLFFIFAVKNKLPRIVLSQVLAILGLISAGFLFFIEFTSNPFVRDIIGSPLEGFDLNPLLQDPGMVSHPPMLYMGYVGFALVFSLALSGLLNARLDKKWLNFMRIWSLFAWSFLTIGITLGSFWSYYVLGWGGFWFWDPVENASFMPWLTGTALIHCLMLSEKRDLFKNWTILLSIVTFALSLVGTFIVRSGVISSVHAFASDPSRGIFILIFLIVVVGGSLGLYSLRSNLLQSDVKFGLFSREMFLSLGNLLLVVLASTVFVGTVYPLVLDVLGFGKISVGPPYFNMVFIPLFFVVAFLLSCGPFIKWGDNNASAIKFLSKLGIGALIVGIIFILNFLYINIGAITLNFVAALFLSSWVFVFSFYKLFQKIRQNNNDIFALSGGFWGMFLGHLSIGIVIFAISVSTVLSDGKDARLKIGESVNVGGYTFRFNGLIDNIKGQNYQAVKAEVVAIKNNSQKILMPEKRFYTTPQIWQTHVAISGGFTEDLYLALGDRYPDGSWTFRIYVKPYIRLLWLGGFLMALGGILSAVSKMRKR